MNLLETSLLPPIQSDATVAFARVDEYRAIALTPCSIVSLHWHPESEEQSLTIWLTSFGPLVLKKEDDEAVYTRAVARFQALPYLWDVPNALVVSPQDTDIAEAHALVKAVGKNWQLYPVPAHYDLVMDTIETMPGQDCGYYEAFSLESRGSLAWQVKKVLFDQGVYIPVSDEERQKLEVIHG